MSKKKNPASHGAENLTPICTRTAIEEGGGGGGSVPTADSS